ncbi:MAG: hypothetical protein GC160_01000 [Acidobacteria bacterium]|nr:hypothetical protein [Acidobacteriota bacterium]
MSRDALETTLSATATVAALALLSAKPVAAQADLHLWVAAAVLLAFGAGALAFRRPPSLPWPALALALWMAWQLAPLPLDWLQALAPQRAEAVRLAQAAGASPATSLAADPAAAWRGAVVWLGAWALFGLARRAARTERGAVWVAGCLAALALAQAVIGLQQYLWAAQSGAAETLARGTFVNRGQFAAFLLTALGPAVGWLAGRDRRQLEPLLAGLAVSGLLAAALAASLSRAALAAAALLALPALACGRRRARLAGAALALAAVLTLTLTSVGARAWARFDRLAAEQGDPGRLAVWADAAPLAARNAVWGAGIGGFGATFERSAPYLPRKSVRHAHSDLYELWIDLGGVGWVLAAIAVLGAFVAVARARPGPLAWGCLAGAAAPLAQAAVDLPLQSPAVAYAAACCLGLAVGLALPEPPRPHPLRRATTAVPALLAAASLAFAPASSADLFARAEQAWAAGDLEQARQGWLATLSAQPRAAAAWLRLSEHARSEGDLDQALAWAQTARRWQPHTVRTEWALADLELATGALDAALARLAALANAAPDLRPAAIQALWRAGVPPPSIEQSLAQSDGRAAGDYLAFLAREGLREELLQANQRLVVQQALQPPEAEAAYIARALQAPPP